MKLRCLAVMALIAFSLRAQDSGVVQGMVVNSVTGVGIAGATVRLIFRSDRYETVTDGAGAFQFSGVKAGDYVASAEKSSFTAPPPRTFPPRQIHIGAGKEPVRLRLELLPPASLRGRVLGIDGHPAAGARVDLGGGITAAAGEDGSFVFENLEPRSYRLVAYPPAAKAKFMQDGVRMEILPTYFPSVLDSSAAQEIRVAPASDLNGYDIRLQAAPVYRVGGVVVYPDGTPAAKAVIEVFPTPVLGTARSRVSVPFGPFSISSGALGGYDLIDPVVSKTDGSFEFPSLPAGDWTLRAEPDTVRDDRGRYVMLYGSEDIRLGRGDLDTVQIRLALRFGLPLKLELEDGSPAQNLSLTIVFEPLDSGLPAIVDLKSGRVESLQSGLYRVSVMPMTNVHQNYYAARVLAGDTDVTRQAVQLSPASPPISVIIKPGFTLRGVVENGENTMVILWPQSSMPGDTGRAIACGAGGIFETDGLAPGDYYALAVDHYEPREMTTASFLRGMIPRATAVRVEDGAAANVQLSVAR